MKRLMIIGCVLAATLAAYVLLQDRAAPITLTDATATAGSSVAPAFMVAMTIENSGPPDRLIQVSSPSGAMVSIMNSDNADAPLVIPGEGSASLAMDGAHLMIMGADAAFAEGAFLPVTLTFENAGDVSTRVENIGTMAMGHAMTNGVQEDPAPSLEITAVTAPSPDGFDIALEVTNFTFTQGEENADHVPNEGHAHVYLNGLKLGRLYDQTYRIGALPPGGYDLTVALNTNDHRPYLDANEPVIGRLTFTIP